jgi:hypothetical protein
MKSPTQSSVDTLTHCSTLFTAKVALDNSLLITTEAVYHCIKYLICYPKAMECITIEEIMHFSENKQFTHDNDQEIIDFLEQDFIVSLLKLLRRDPLFYNENCQELLYSSEISPFHQVTTQLYLLNGNQKKFHLIFHPV